METRDQIYIQLLFNSAGTHPLKIYTENTEGQFDENVFGINLTCHEGNQKLPVKVVRLSAYDQFILDGKFDIQSSSFELKSILIEDFNKVDDFMEYSPLNLIYFGFYTSNIANLRLKLEISLRSSDATSYKHFYESFITGHQLTSQNYSTVVGPLLKKNCDQIYGHLNFDYLVVRPWDELRKFQKLRAVDLENLPKPILVGHRGSGISFGSSPSRYLENTIDSFLRASDCGAPFVELDAQLTRDHHVIVYHDFLTEPLTSRENSDDISEDLMDHLDIPIRDLKLSQLKLHKFLHATMPNHNEKAGRANHTSSERQIGCMFPLLRDVMQKLPPNVGINVELKYPQQERDGSWELEGSYFDRNIIAERVLQVVFEENLTAQRPIIFSSFDPALCIALSHKQNIYPVLFLVEEIDAPDRGYVDYRTRAVKTAILFASAENLQGICSSVDTILPIISSVSSEAHKRNLHLFTYGAQNSDMSNILTQTDAKVDGIIFDRIYDFMPDLIKQDNPGISHLRTSSTSSKSDDQT